MDQRSRTGVVATVEPPGDLTLGQGRGGAAESTVAQAGNGPADVSAENGDYPIGKLAKLAGVSTRTVRYYEEIGLLRTARRYAGGRRVFDGDALQRLRFIARLKGLGFSLEEVSHLNEIFELNRSTAEMLNVLDGKMDRHLDTIDERVRELDGLRQEIQDYRTHIGTRLNKLGR